MRVIFDERRGGVCELRALQGVWQIPPPTISVTIRASGTLFVYLY